MNRYLLVLLVVGSMLVISMVDIVEAQQEDHCVLDFEPSVMAVSTTGGAHPIQLWAEPCADKGRLYNNFEILIWSDGPEEYHVMVGGTDVANGTVDGYTKVSASTKLRSASLIVIVGNEIYPFGDVRFHGGRLQAIGADEDVILLELKPAELTAAQWHASLAFILFGTGGAVFGLLYAAYHKPSVILRGMKVLHARDGPTKMVESIEGFLAWRPGRGRKKGGGGRGR